MKKKQPGELKPPKALARQVQKLQLAKDFRELEAARREHMLREQRANVLAEVHRLQGAGERILPGLREHLARRNAQLRQLTTTLRPHA